MLFFSRMINRGTILVWILHNISVERNQSWYHSMITIANWLIHIRCHCLIKIKRTDIYPSIMWFWVLIKGVK